MSAIGLPMNGHVAGHFAPDGLCQCPCDQCTTRTAKFCVCLDCPCEDQAEHDRGGVTLSVPVEWVAVEFPAPMPIAGLDGSTWTMTGAAIGSRQRPEVIHFGPFDDEPDDECEGAP